jgi:DHA1 family bicyclomycin/chloramphenicol resistance-like MFS transporter
MEKKQQNMILLVLGAVSGLGPFAVDMYVPGFSAIARDLKTSASLVALTLTSFTIGIAIGQLMAGPVLDRYGRKKPMFFGLLVFIAAAVCSIFVQSIYVLIVLRFFLAIGCCVGMVGSSAVVRDLFTGSDMARALSIMSMIFGIAPVIAPTIGGAVVSAAGWRAVFVILTGIGLCVAFSVQKTLPETKGHDASISLHPFRVVRGYYDVLKTRQFLIYALIGGCASGGLFSYITGSPTVLIDLFHFSPRGYGLIFGANALIVTAANQVNRVILRRSSPGAVLRIIPPIQSAIAVILLVGTYLGLYNWVAVLILMACYLFCFGFLMPNSTAILLQPFSRNAGSAAALGGSLGMVTATIASAAISYLHDGTAMPMAIMFAVFSLSSLVLITIERKTIKVKIRS